MDRVAPLAMTCEPARAGEAVREVALATGVLRLRVREERWPLDALCGFAARDNPRRGFLVVSRVLGRHLPARPRIMRASARDLVALLPADLPGPVLVMGLAETAVCLGQRVHAELRAATARDDIVYLHSTRVRIDAPLLARFDEPHSHAARHLVYAPRVPGFVSPRSLVLVDDEVSTGTTLANLAAALVERWPGIEAIAVATLADWSGGGSLARLPRPASATALLRGTLDWTPDPAVRHAAPPGQAPAFGRMARPVNRGRQGLRASGVDVPEIVIAGEAPLRIVATGEFGYAPFLLAERLEAAGRDVVVQATSRSPARIGGAIRHAHRFADNYGAAVPNYLYNAPPGDGRETLICHETPAGSVDPALVAALAARTLGWP